jgi:hypothetical protein
VINNTICLVDISPFLYSGVPYKQNRLVAPVRLGTEGYSQPSLKAGGVAFLFEKVGRLLGGGNDVILCSDRPPAVKQSFYPEYKATRNSKIAGDIKQQRLIVERIAEDCGIPITYRDGIEADDLVHAYWREAQRMYEKVEIYVNDSDMSMLVNGKSTIQPCNSRGRTVTMENFEQAAVPKQVTPYNSVVISKVLFGDKSDNIAQVLRTRDAYALWDLMVADMAIHMGHGRIVNDMLIKRYTPVDWLDKLLLQLQVVFPIDQEVTIFEMDYNKERFAEWCRALDMYGYGRPGYSDHTSRVTQQLYEEFHSREGEQNCEQSV